MQHWPGTDMFREQAVRSGLVRNPVADAFSLHCERREGRTCLVNRVTADSIHLYTALYTDMPPNVFRRLLAGQTIHTLFTSVRADGARLAAAHRAILYRRAPAL